MANANTEVTLEQMQIAIAAAVKDAFPSFKTVEFDRDDEAEGLPCPACLMEFMEAEPAPAEDAGTGQWPALARFEARVILNARKTAKAEVKKAAVALAAWLYNRRFPGIFTDPCQPIACEPDEFSPDVDKFRVWRVEWVMPAMFGGSAWFDPEDDPATFKYPTPMFSCVPAIGVEHKDDYEPAIDTEARPL